jgi:hypothetical protein
MTVFPLLAVRVKLEKPSTPASADVVAKATAEATNTKALFIFKCLQAMLTLVRERSEETDPAEREGKVRWSAISGEHPRKDSRRTPDDQSLPTATRVTAHHEAKSRYERSGRWNKADAEIHPVSVVNR